jgi:MFS transporter, FHS family, L-fucose permease
MASKALSSGVQPARARAVPVLPLLLIVSLFFMWGVANNLNDILVQQFRKAFTLTDLQSGLVQSVFYFGYFALALPAGFVMRRLGYKSAVIIGLLLYAAGAFLFWPAAAAHQYPLFLLALFVIAAGLTFLETSANPLITQLGPPETAERRLTLAQAFNPLGSITGVLIGRFFIFSGVEHSPEELAAMSVPAREAYFAAESAMVQGPYLVIGIIVMVWAAVVALTRFPDPHDAPRASGDASEDGARLRSLVAEPRLMSAVLAQFCYVGAQVAVWSYMIRYGLANVPGLTERSAADYLTAALVVFMIGRFSGAALMTRIAPERLLAAYAIANVLLTFAAVVLPGRVGLWCLVASSFFMSVMYPAIFAIGVRGFGEAKKLASSLLVMAIIGGAVITAGMGAMSDAIGIAGAMALPAAAYLFVLFFALVGARWEVRRP